jgi:hypothetical protein
MTTPRVTETAITREGCRDLSAAELTVIATALDFAATETTLKDRRAMLAPFTSDLSSAPLVRIANRVRAIRDAR